MGRSLPGGDWLALGRRPVPCIEAELAEGVCRPGWSVAGESAPGVLEEGFWLLGDIESQGAYGGEGEV